jgi:hypothetical protein
MRVLTISSLLLALAACGGLPSSPLISAARNGDTAEIRRLAAAGADPNETGGANGWTALMHAIHKHRDGSVAVLLDAGANPNARVGSGHTALIMAAGYGYTGTVKLLLARGADPRLTTANGDSALEAAVAGTTDIDRFTLGDCQASTVRALLDKDPTLKIRDSFWGRMSKRAACAETVKLLESRRN